MGNLRIAVGLTLVLLGATFGASADQDEISRSALVIIDVQHFYFPGGSASLVEPERASQNASKILGSFRSKGDLVVHVRHKASKGAEIHEHVAPTEGERVFTKTEVSCFNGTDLLAYLQEQQVSKLVICGMMTHMCVEAAVRAAHDLGFEVTVVGDACATRDLEFEGTKIAAADVHASTLATLARTYSKVVTTEEFLAEDQADVPALEE
jgi:nicotinamidase-related amidase